jgi:hypothetical protein
MRKIKGSGSYLKKQVRKNMAKAVFCLFLFFLIIFIVGLSVLYAFTLTILDLVVLLVSLVPLGAFYYYLRKYRIYRGGWAGEKQVTNLLNSRLSDDYFLLNDLHLRNGDGDIDHIVLGPGGVFVLETKNWRGRVSCRGDKWERVGRRDFKGSPSLQVKRNTAKIKRIIDSFMPGVQVEGIVVFTNDHATLRLDSPTVPILTLPELADHITSLRSGSNLSQQQIESIGQVILKQKN